MGARRVGERKMARYSRLVNRKLRGGTRLNAKQEEECSVTPSTCAVSRRGWWGEGGRVGDEDPPSNASSQHP